MIARIYVAGSYSAPTLEARLENVARAKRVARTIVEAGGYAVCPHLLSEACDDLHDWEWWMAATSRALETCDAVVIVAESERSIGTGRECAQAGRLGQPVFRATEDGLLPDDARGFIARFGEVTQRGALIAELERERDAAFAMSRCECASDECCRNLVAKDNRIAELDAEVLRLKSELAGARRALDFAARITNERPER